MNFHPRECVFVSSQHFPLSHLLTTFSFLSTWCCILISTRVNFHFLRNFLNNFHLNSLWKSRNKFLLPRDFLSVFYFYFLSFFLLRVSIFLSPLEWLNESFIVSARVKFLHRQRRRRSRKNWEKFLWIFHRLCVYERSITILAHTHTANAHE